MHIQKASFKHLPQITPVYEQARQFMSANGNGKQWINGYPSEEILRRDIMEGNLYLCVHQYKLAAVFCFKLGDDPTYAAIKGQWLREEKYAVIHRLAVVQHGRGIASFCIRWCLQQWPDLRIDTHADNIPMQKTLLKNGFVYCGIIYTDNGTERRAYQNAAPAPIKKHKTPKKRS